MVVFEDQAMYPHTFRGTKTPSIEKHGLFLAMVKLFAVFLSLVFIIYMHKKKIIISNTIPELDILLTSSEKPLFLYLLPV